MNRPLQYCAQPGCAVLVPRGRCSTHVTQRDHGRDDYAIRRWYRTTRWARLRLQVLVDACYVCAHCHHVHLHLEVDHIIKHEGNDELFWNRENLQPLCARCHNAKTQLETRGFVNNLRGGS